MTVGAEVGANVVVVSDLELAASSVGCVTRISESRVLNFSKIGKGSVTNVTGTNFEHSPDPP